MDAAHTLINELLAGRDEPPSDERAMIALLDEAIERLRERLARSGELAASLVAVDDDAAPADGPRAASRQPDVPEDAPPALTREVEAVRTAAGREPLRLALLDLLAASSATPTTMAARLGTSREVIARVLRELRADGLVTHAPDTHDRRKRVYSLTAQGGHERGLAHRYGNLPPAAQPDDETRSRRAKAAIDIAVTHRRTTNQLDDVVARLQAVLELATRHRMHEIELTARAELVTTLRQIGDVRALRPHVEALRTIALGKRDDVPPRLIPAAAAHVDYEEGRLGRRLPPAVAAREKRPEKADAARAESREHGPAGRDDAYREQAAALVRATAGFRSCAAMHPTRVEYGLRAGWAQLSYADLLRARASRIEAIEAAETAACMFTELDDSYGLSRSEFLIGFCLRLGGYFPAAHKMLDRSLARAQEHNFPRFIADTLMQLGEVERQRHDYAAALDLLREAESRALALAMPVTVGFARSSIGATYFSMREWDHARVQLRAALETFAPTRHPEGIALTNRRLAALERADHRTKEASVALAEAAHRYKRLASPAGILGCKLEQLAIAPAHKRTAVVDDVVAMLRPGSRNRSLIEQDPWTPSLLREGSERVGDAALIEVAGAVEESARERFAESSRRLGLPADAGDYPEQPDAMAGEPMRKFTHRVAVVA